MLPLAVTFHFFDGNAMTSSFNPTTGITPYRTGDASWPGGTLAVIDPLQWSTSPPVPNLKTINVIRRGVSGTTHHSPQTAEVLHMQLRPVLRSLERLPVAIGGVLPGSDAAIMLAAQIADHLHLPGYGAEAAHLLSDRWAAYCRLIASQCRTAHSRRIATLDQAMSTAKHLGYPVMLRARQPDGSAWPTPLRDLTGLALAYGELRNRLPNDDLIVQHLPAGMPVHVYCLTSKGQSTVLAVLRPLIVPTNCGSALAQGVDAGDSLRYDSKVRTLAVNALRAVGVVSGLTHIHMRITPAGPVLIHLAPATTHHNEEHDLIHLAMGINLSAVAAVTALGAATVLAEHDYRSALAAPVHIPGVKGRTNRWWQPQLDLPELGLPFIHRLDWSRNPEPACGCAAIGTVILTGNDRGHCQHLLRQVYAQLGALPPDNAD